MHEVSSQSSRQCDGMTPEMKAKLVGAECRRLLLEFMSFSKEERTLIRRTCQDVPTDAEIDGLSYSDLKEAK